MRCLDRSRAAVVLGLAALILSPPVRGQEKPVNGIRPADLRAHAIVGATVVVRPGVTVENATIVIRDGTIEAVGTDLDIPADARRWPADGLTVYAGLIDAAVFVDVVAPPAGAGRHWNAAIHPETSMAEQPLPPASVRKSLRELGFTAAAFYPSKGIFRGSGAVLALADDAVHVRTYRKRAAMAMGFDRGGGGSSRSTPSSLMGVIALVRQTLLDARWHADGLGVYLAHPDGNEPPPAADALVALRSVLAREQPVLFETGDELNLLRAARLADEYDLDAIMLGSGMEFRRLKEIAATRRPIIVPLEYPDRPDVSSVSLADRTTLRTMMTWEQAPTNARRLVDAGVTVALTTHGLETRKDFPGAVRKAIRHGLSEGDALAALTTTPARLLGLDHVLGTIEPGKLANLVVVDGHLFEKDAKVRATWINGRRSEIDDQPEATLVLHGTLTTSDGLALAVDLDTTKPSVSFELPDDKRATAKKITVLRERISIVVDGRPFGAEGYVQLSGAPRFAFASGSRVGSCPPYIVPVRPIFPSIISG